MSIIDPSSLKNEQWVPVKSTGKFFDGWIRDLEFNPHLYQKAIIKSKSYKLKLSQVKVSDD